MCGGCGGGGGGCEQMQKKTQLLTLMLVRTHTNPTGRPTSFLRVRLQSRAVVGA